MTNERLILSALKRLRRASKRQLSKAVAEGMEFGEYISRLRKNHRIDLEWTTETNASGRRSAMGSISTVEQSNERR